MTASDTNTNTGANSEGYLLGRVVCKAPVGTAGAWVPVLPSTSGASATLFPVGSVLVVCTTKDEATNESPAVSFTVTVRCPASYALKENACVGEWFKHALAIHATPMDMRHILHPVVTALTL
jgi:hypothetical protein